MSSYSKSAKKLHPGERFSQIAPYRKCNCGKKCRDPRCSFEGFKGWAIKQAGIVAHFLKHHRQKSQVYRGCLKLPFNATIDDHKKVRSKFLASIKRHEKRFLSFIKIRAWMHTEYDGCHYEYLAYSNAPKVDDIIRDLWKKAGGERPTCIAIDDDQIDRWSRYNTKASKRHNPKYLADKNGLDMVWGSSKFFTMPEDRLWAECCDSWYSVPSHIMQSKIAQDLIQNPSNLDLIGFTSLTPEQRDQLFINVNSDVLQVCHEEAQIEFKIIQSSPWRYKEKDRGKTLAEIQAKLVRGWRKEYEQIARYSAKFPAVAKEIEHRVDDEYKASRGKRYCIIRSQVWSRYFSR